MRVDRSSVTLGLVLAGSFLMAGAGTVWIARLETRAAQSERARGNSRPLDVDGTRLSEAIERSADYIVRMCKPDGQFVYCIHLRPGIEPDPPYNIIRHAGTMYALATYHDRSPSEDTRKALLRAGRFLKERCIGPIPGREGLQTVWTRPEITGNYDAALQSDLGGAGLGLVGLVGLENAEPGATPREVLRGLARFLLYMQKDDGSFYTKYVPVTGGRWDEITVIYYPGEAALGLLLLDELDPSEKWLHGAARAIGYLAKTREGKDDVPADHWALLATAQLVPRLDHCKAIISKQAVLRHAVQICESILRAEPDRTRGPGRDGCFTDDGRTCPTSTRLEGLLAALQFLPEEHESLRERIKVSVRRGISFLLDAQVGSGKYAGAMPRAISPLPTNHPRNADGEFNERAYEVRIDYVQHAMSAMIAFERRFFPRPEHRQARTGGRVER